MAAMFRRPRPGGGGHPPPLAPTVSSFKPRAQWSNSESSVFLYVNLPGFYIDQIKINKDERTRSIQIQGERRLSSHTKARFNEAYRVPESCDMSKLNTSFSHGLLSIEFPKVVEGEKPEKAVQDQGNNNVQRSNQEKQVGTTQEKVSPPMAKEQEPKTYKSVLEGKKAVATGSNQEKLGQKMKEGEASPSLGRKERVKIERKEDAKMGQQKTVQKKVEEERAQNTPTISGSLNPKDKVIERTDKGQEKTGQKKVKEITRTPTFDDRLDPKVHAKTEKAVDGETSQKLKEEAKPERFTKPVVEDEARRTKKEIVATNKVEPKLKTKESVERIARDVNGKRKNDEKMVRDKVSEGETQGRVKQKKVEEAGLVKETRDVKNDPEFMEPEKVDSDDALKKELTSGSGYRTKMVEKSLESETGPFLAEKRQKNTNMDPLAVGARRTDEEESQKYDTSLVNVGVAALVIMVFGAYAFVPLVKLFIS